MAKSLKTHEDRMRFVIGLADRNARNGGGPFGAAVFDLKTGRVLATGVNRVLQTCDPTAHAEMNALRAACRRAGSHSLFREDRPVALYASAEPCGMCCTALLWAGVSALVSAATTRDVEGIGFDEGLKPVSWVSLLRKKGLSVTRGFLRKEAVAVLDGYRRKGGRIYNGR